MSFWNNIPGVGHVKGVIHLACGDKEEGIKALEEANRTTLIAVGVSALVPTCPVAPVAAAVTTVVSQIDKIIKH